MWKLMRKGQSTAEYAIVIGLVIAAAVAMQVYVKRGIQGKIKGVVDHSPDTARFTKGYQYEPYYATSNMDSTRNLDENIYTDKGGSVVRTIAKDGEVSTRTGVQTTAISQE